MSGETAWSLPDWTKLEGYPMPCGSEEMCVWAWEFLRRNPEYRMFWKGKIEPFIDFTAGGSLSSHNELKARVLPASIYHDAEGNVWPHHEELKARFGINLPARPDSSTAPYFIARWITSIENDGKEIQQISLEEHQVAYFFDLTRPLERQFEMALELARRQQNYRQRGGTIRLKRSRRRTEKYVLYLRIIDAIDCGAKPTEIADLLFPNIPNDYPENKRLKVFYDNQKAAQKLRDGGYRALLELA